MSFFFLFGSLHFLQYEVSLLIDNIYPNEKKILYLDLVFAYEMLFAIWYHLYNLKTMKDTHGGVLFLVTLQAKACNFTKSNILQRFFSHFLNCTNGAKSGKTYHISCWSRKIFANILHKIFEDCLYSICRKEVILLLVKTLTSVLLFFQLKCEQYWPLDTGLQYKDIVVKVISVNELTDYTVRIFEIYKVREVLLF